MTYDRLAFRLYKDGVLDRTVVSGESYLNTPRPWTIGRFVTGNMGWPFAGGLDDLRLYRRVLTGSEITALLAAGPVGNQPPVLSAGSDQLIVLPALANLDGTVTDDGLPSNLVTVAWSVVSGPGAVTFGNSNAVDTTAAFATNGVYVLRLAASDGEFTAQDEVTLTVNEAAADPTLIGHLPFNETMGATALDATGNGHDGTLLNGAAFTPAGRLAGGVSLDGSNDHVEMADAPGFEVAGRSFTVGIWVKTTKTSAQMLVEKRNTGWPGEFLFALNRDNSVPGGFSVWTGNQWIDSIGRGLADGQWHHLAVTYDRTAFRLYRDGALDRVVIAGESYVDSGLPWTLGRFIVGSVGWSFAGQLDDFRLYQRALSDVEVAALLNP